MMPAVGEAFSKRHTFTKGEIADFARRCGDTNPLHFDAAMAARSRFGGIIASGPHATAMLMAMTAERFADPHGMVGLEFTVRFEKPIAADADTTMSWMVTGVEPKDRICGDVVDLAGNITDQAGELLVSATGRVLVWRATANELPPGDKA